MEKCVGSQGDVRQGSTRSLSEDLLLGLLLFIAVRESTSFSRGIINAQLFYIKILKSVKKTFKTLLSRREPPSVKLLKLKLSRK